MSTNLPRNATADSRTPFSWNGNLISREQLSLISEKPLIKTRRVPVACVSPPPPQMHRYSDDSHIVDNNLTSQSESLVKTPNFTEDWSPVLERALDTVREEEEDDASSVMSTHPTFGMSFASFCDEDVPTSTSAPVGVYWTPDTELNQATFDDYDETEEGEFGFDMLPNLSDPYDDFKDTALKIDMKFLRRISSMIPREPVEGPYVSLKESVRAFKEGKDISAHALKLKANERGLLISTCKHTLRPDGASGIAKVKRKRRAPQYYADMPKAWVEREHVLHATGKPEVQKPHRFHMGEFRAWIDGESSKIRNEMKGKVPVLNDAGVALLGHGDLSAAQKDALLGRTRVDAVAWSALKSRASTVAIFRKELVVGSLVLSSEAEVDVLETYFRKHRPIEKVCRRFFRGDRTIDVGTLACDLDMKVFPFEKRHEAHDRLELWRSVQSGSDKFEDHEIVELQGTAHSSPIKTYAQEATVSMVETVENTGAMDKMGESFGSGFVRGARKEFSTPSTSELRPILNIVIGLASMAASTTPTQFLLAASQTLINDPIAMEFFDRIRTSVILQGAKDIKPGDNKEAAEEKEVDSWWSEIAGLSALSAMRSFFGNVYEALVPSFLEMCGAIKFASLKAFSMSIAEKIADLLMELIARVKACWTAGSLQPLIRVDAGRWCRHSTGVLQYADYITSKGDGKMFRSLGVSDELPPLFRHHMTHAELSEGLQTHLDEGERLAQFVADEKREVIDSILRKLRAFKASIGYYIQGSSQRVTPYAVLFHGIPGTGKSTDADELARALTRLEGRSETDIYTYRDENFRTSFKPSTCVVRMDDPDASVAATTAGFEDHCAFFQRVVNSSPYPIERADVEGKGKDYARPTDVVVASNTDHLRAVEFSTDPGAVWRRIKLWIEVSVKPQFATPGGLLDLTKPSTGNPRLYTLYRFRSGNGHELQKTCIATKLEWHAMMKFVLADRKKFLDREYSLIANQAEICEECYFSKHRCICVVRQGVSPSKMNLDEISDRYHRFEDDCMMEWSRKIQIIKEYFEENRGVGKLVLAIGVTGGALLAIRLFHSMVTTQGREAGLANDSWFRANPIKEPALPETPPTTWSMEQMCTAVRTSLVEIKGSSINLQGVIFCPGWVLFPTHVFSADGLAEIKYRGYVYKIRQDGCKRLLNAEFSIVYISGLTGCNGVRTYWSPFPVNAARIGPGYLLGTREYELKECTSATQNGFPMWKYEPLTQNGDCGSVLVAKGPGEGPWIFGMHLYGALRFSGAPQLSRNQIECIIDRETPVRVMYQGGAPKLQGPLQHYPAMSEINVAQTHYNTNCIHWGTGRTTGRSMKSAFRPTRYHDAVKEFAALHDIFSDYCVPEFRGAMTPDDLYFSPFIHALRDNNRSTTTYLDCVQEYVDRFKGHFGGQLSEAETIVGVPGEFNSINLKTSMGPPIYGPKRKHIDRDNAEVSPEVAAQMDEIRGILKQKKIPTIFVEATLKDEILKRLKNARVFCMLPAPVNMTGKSVFAPLKRAMRSSYFASRCAVGLDFGSRKCEDFIEYLIVYALLYDLDLKKMDKMWTPELWDAVAEVVRDITNFSAGPEAAWEAWAMVMALKESVIVIKGDMFTAFWNPSGNDVTVELNTIALALMLIKVTRLRQCSLDEVTYGDDLAGGANTPLPTDFFERFQEITGFEATDGAKGSVPTGGRIEDVVFLKRRPRYDEQYKCWTMPLEESSIVKMLLFRGKSALSGLDHELTLVQDAARFAVLHGRVKYERWKTFLNRIEPTARLPDYDESMKAYVDGVFTDWMDRTVVHDGSAEGTITLQGYGTLPYYEGSTETISLSMHSERNEGANELKSLPMGQDVGVSPNETDAQVDEIDADTVKIVSAGETQHIGDSTPFRVLGNLVSPQLNNFPERWTRIATTNLASTDVPLAIGVGLVGDFCPMDLLMANALMDNKTKNWAYYRAGIQVMGVVSIPGNASGAYAVSAGPVMTTYRPSSINTFDIEDILAFEHSTLLLCSASANIEFDLPFFSCLDANALSSPIASGAWQIRVGCLSPLRTAISGGVTTGTITWHVRLVDYELLVPSWQGAVSYQGKKEMIAGVKSMKENKSISKASASVKQIADKLVGVPFLGQAASMVSMAAGTVGSIADFFGFSRVNEEAVQTAVMTRSIKNVALTDGTDHGDVAGFTCSNKISMAPDLVGGNDADPMSFESMSQRWRPVSTFVWSAADAATTVLKEVYVTPGFGLGDLNTLRPTGAGYCGLPFQYWRAEAEYLIVIPASVLHRGALQLFYVAPESNAPIAADNVMNSGLGAVLDISSATTFQAHVGFASNRPMLPLIYFTSAWAILPVGSGNGSLQFRVLNPLVSQNPVDTLNITIFVRFKNVQFAVPRTTVQWPNAANDGLVTLQWEDGVTLQGKAVGDHDDADHEEIFDLVPGVGPYPVSEVVAGEDIRSLRALAQRPSRLIFANQNESVIYPGGMATYTGQTSRITTAGLAMRPFISGAASERVKVIPRSDSSIGCWSLVSTNIDAVNTLYMIPAHAPMTYTGPQKGAEFVLPYYFPARSRGWGATGALTALSDLHAADRVIVLYSNGTSPQFRAYYSLGDDIRVGPYYRMPRFTFARVATAGPGWFAPP